MHEVTKLEEDLRDICNLEKKLVDSLENGKYDVDSEEGGQIVDMIKDLCEAKKDAWKALYYKTVICSMKESQEERERHNYGDGIMGYDPWRYPSSGRFAPTGKGVRSGYNPINGPYPDTIYGFMPEEIFDEEWRMMGYDSNRGNSSNGRSSGRSGNRSGNNGNNNSGSYGYNPNDMRSLYGEAYDRWKDARRHYTDTKSKEDKDEMDSRAEECVVNAMKNIKEVWKEADPAFKKEIKSDISELLGDMDINVK